METRAYFKDIQSHLIGELESARSEIVIAVPWFTDRKLFDLICRQSRKGIRVQVLLMQDEINRSGRIPFQLLETNGGQLFWVPEGGRLMHNKFAVIDQQTVVTGSYNWSNKAQINDENITVISGNLGLAAKYIETYQKMIRGLGYKSSLKPILDPRAINLRLQAIRNFIELEEMETLSSQADKLLGVEEDRDLQDIIASLSERMFERAKQQIIRYLESHQQIAIYVDPEIHQLELLLQALEIELNALSDQKMEMEREIISFDLQTTEHLGEYIEEYLRLRSEVLNKIREIIKEREVDNTEDAESEYQEAQEEYEEYQKEYDEVKNEPSSQLDSKGKKQLKKLYRKASHLCHPDKMDDANKEVATEVFVKLNEAYKKNDLQTVQAIVSKLENGQFNVRLRSAIEDRTLLELRVKELRNEITIITKELVTISRNESYLKVISIDDFDDYFKQQREQLEDEIAALEKELHTLDIELAELSRDNFEF